jgi:Fe-S-cluster containining protein
MSLDMSIAQVYSPTKGVSLENVYFAFASGRLGHDCQECRAQCCRGYGYNIRGALEVAAQLERRPAIGFFLQPTSDACYAARTFPPACFFLDDSNRCAIHKELGYAAKPETCRLFPFSDLRLVSGHLIVAAQATLCPLDVLPVGRESEQSAHERLLTELAAQELTGTVRLGHATVEGVAELLQLETELRSASERHLDDRDYGPFAVEQLAAAARHGFRSEWGANLPADDFVALLLRVLGAEETVRPGLDRDVSRVLVGATAGIRSQLLFGDGRGPAAPVTSMDRIPRLLLALHVLLWLVRAAGMRTVSYQTVNRVFSEYRRLLGLLAYVDCEMVWSDSAEVDPVFDGSSDEQAMYLAVCRTLLPGNGIRGGRSFGEILIEYSPPGLAGRANFLRRLVPRLSGQIAPVGLDQGSRGIATVLAGRGPGR